MNKDGEGEVDGDRERDVKIGGTEIAEILR